MDKIEFDENNEIKTHEENKNLVLPCSNGCGMKGRAAARAKHEGTHCPLRPIPCDLCGDLVPKRHMKVHQRNSCLDREVKCLMCRQPIKVREMDDHYAICRPETPAEERMRRLEEIKKRAGPHRCEICNEILAIEFEDQHLASSCRIVQCPECDKTILKKDRSHHLEKECRETTATCGRCGESIKRRVLLQHQKEECTMRTIQCEMCEDIVIAADLVEHKEKDCLQEMVECTSGCGCPEMLRIDLPRHLELECELRKRRCEGCQQRFAAHAFADHLATCMPLNRYWEEAVAWLGETYSTPSLQRRMRKLLECWKNEPETALVALADSKGDVQFAVEKLRRQTYYDHLKLICQVCDVNRFISSENPTRKKERAEQKVKQGGLKITASEPVMVTKEPIDSGLQESNLKHTLTSTTINS